MDTTNWATDACTLPTVEQPLREAEFDELFAAAVQEVERVDPTTLRLGLVAGAEEWARELAGRETECCSFFGFDVRAGLMTVTVPAAYVAVLDAFADRASQQAL